jgi:hypothetical protein
MTLIVLAKSTIVHGLGGLMTRAEASARAAVDMNQEVLRSISSLAEFLGA